MTTLSGNRIVPRSINASAGNKTIDLDLLLNQTCSVRNNGAIVINGLVSGPKGFVISGSGVMDLKNNNTYSGDTIIRDGTLKISGTGTLGTDASYAGAMTINGTLDYSSSAYQSITGSINHQQLFQSVLELAGVNKISVNGTGRLHFKNAPSLTSAGVTGGNLIYAGYTVAQFYGFLEVNSGYLRIGNNSDTEYGLNMSSLTGIHVGVDGTFEYDVQNAVSTAPTRQVTNTTRAPITGSGDFVVMNGWLIASGRGSTFSGNMNINSTGTLELTRRHTCTIVNNGTVVLSPISKGNWNGLDSNLSKAVNDDTVTYTLNSDYVFTGGEGNVTAQLQSAGFGNEASEFSGFVAGRVALVQRGVATFQTKVNNAVSAGASAVIIYNNETGLITPSVTSNIPVFFITQELGEQLVVELESDTVNVNVDTGYEVGELALPELFGEMTGSGSLAKGGTSTLVVNATPGLLNTGDTKVNSGVLRLASSDALPSSTEFVVTTGASLELTGDIVQTKNLAVAGAGISSGGAVRNVSGNNTISGTTSLQGPNESTAVRINSDSGLLVMGGDVSGLQPLIVGGAGETQFNGTIAISNKTLTKDGAGMTTLTGENTYTGGTTLNAGTLKVGNGGSTGSLASSSIVVNANGTLVFDRTGEVTCPGAISNTGAVIKQGSGKLILTATNSNTGSFTISEGAVQIGNGATTGALANNPLTNNGALIFNRSNAYTYAPVIAGTGSVEQAGTGTTSLTGDSTYTGGTTVSAGTLSIGAGGTIGSITGDVINNATLQFNRSDAYTYSGVISGTGNVVKAAVGTTTLSGNNSYGGTTTVSTGVLRMGHANAFSTSVVTVISGRAVEVTGELTVANDFSIAGGGVSSGGALRSLSNLNVFNGAITQTGASRINSDVGLLTINSNIGGAFALSIGGSGNTRIDGTITNATTLTKDGDGTLELTSVNTYTSTTTISAGILKLTGVGTVGASTINNNATLVVENDDNTTIAVAIGGSGAVTKNLNTKVIFNGANTYTGTTTINEGTFALGAGGTVGSFSGTTGDFVVASGATFEINRSNASTFARAISGDGVVTVLGGGTTSFSGNLTHTGGTTVNAGILSIGANGTIGSITGDIVNNSAVQLNRADAYTYSGAISGTGNLVKVSVGTTTLSGNSTFSGTTTISGGALRVASSDALGSTSGVTINSNTALELIGGIILGRNLTSNGTGISGGGSLRNISGNNTLDGNYTLTNTSRINSDADILVLSSNGTFTGASRAITFGGSGNILVQRPIETTTGAVTKDGAGTLVLSAANTYTGVTTMSGGTTRFANVFSLYNNTAANWVKTKITVNTGATFAINVGGADEFTTANVATLLTNLLVTINNNGLRSGSSIGFDTTNSPVDFDISSNITDSTGTGAGSVGIVKLGTGTLVLSGSDNTYTGNTVINGGTLKAGNATCFGSGTITLNAGTTLDKAGFSITNTIVNNGGTIID